MIDLPLVLNDLLGIEHGAVEAYDAAIRHVQDAPLREALDAFRAGHLQHVSELSDVVTALGSLPAAGPDLFRYATEANLAAAKAVTYEQDAIAVLRATEQTTIHEFEATLSNGELPPPIRVLLDRKLRDARCRLAWFENVGGAATP